ncbi:MAG: DNA polymerase III subunit beta, partial [Candidatus Marinamargulisbacteria bacterium]|nr:DNA polymerase III subunit beta [Candidatus Marinamargulisbacteria bacterium]
MEFSCNSELFFQAITQVGRAISNQNTIDALNNFYIELYENKLTLRGYNLTLGIESSIPIDDCTVCGRVLIRAKTLHDVVRHFDNETLFFKCDSNHMLTLKSDRFSFDLRGQSCDNYPVFPSMDNGTQFNLAYSLAKDSLSQALFAASSDETQDILSGVLFKHETGQLMAVGADGFRLALKQVVADTPDFYTILPARSMQEFIKLIAKHDKSDTVAITITEHQAQFVFKNTVLVTRVMQGMFPDYNKIKPTTFEYSFQVSKRKLQGSCERASIISAEANDVVSFRFHAEGIHLTAKANALGKFEEMVQATSVEYAQTPLTLSFNIRMVLDGLRAIESDDVIIAFNSAETPCLMTPASDESFTYIVMPVRVASSA